MKVIEVGNRFEIRDDSLKVFDVLPPHTYAVRFSKLSGFYLERRDDLEIKEKIYGVHDEKVNKVMTAFRNFDRSLGVILSGDKGIGKSVFARMVSQKAVSCGIPVIIVDSYVPGIAAYIESIEQDAVIFFDEFDKTFRSSRGEDGPDSQSTMLSLFDGMANGKKLFLVTCNDIHGLNDYLINRPGRFHYHFRFEYPNDDEIRAYLEDKIDQAYWGQIDKVIAFSKRVDLNYDCLRSIAYELNTGLAFFDAIQDLNIINMSALDYTLTLHFEDGTIMTRQKYKMDMFNSEDCEDVWVRDSDGNITVCVSFFPSDCGYDAARGISVISADKFTLSYDDDNYSSAEVTAAKKLKPSYLEIARIKGKNYHYQCSI